MIVDFSKQQQEVDFLKMSLKKFALEPDLWQAIAQMGRMVRDHRHLERLLTEAEPEMRVELYESLRPHLRFQAKPLDQYIADAKHRAEAEKLPLLGPNGQLQEFRPAQDVRTLERHAEDAIAASLASRMLTLTCAKCMKQQQYYAVGDETQVAVIIKARKDGWIYDNTGAEPREICPTCPTALRKDA